MLLQALIFVIGVTITGVSMAQVRTDSKVERAIADEQSPTTPMPGIGGSGYKGSIPFTDVEKSVLLRAMTGKATATEMRMATEVCSKKCQECINGADCNLDCAKKACFK
jgi:hypothetical protein